MLCKRSGGNLELRAGTGLRGEPPGPAAAGRAGRGARETRPPAPAAWGGSSGERRAGDAGTPSEPSPPPAAGAPSPNPSPARAAAALERHPRSHAGFAVEAARVGAGACDPRDRVLRPGWTCGSLGLGQPVDPSSVCPQAWS